MRSLHRSLAMGAAVLLAAACSTDSPMGVDSGVEIAPMVAMDSHLLTVELCKSWVGEDPAPETPFEFTVSANGEETTVSILAEACADVGPWAPGTTVSITEDEAGSSLAAIWLLSRTETDGDGFPVTEIIADPEEPSVSFLVDEVVRVFFKNADGDVLPLEIAKTVMASYDRTHSWELTKTVEPSSHAGGPGASFSSDWTVTATKTTLDDNFQVSGVISVTNPNGFDVAFTLTDALDDGTGVTITCPGTGDNTGTAPANGSVDCAYTASPTDASATENTATVTSDVGGDSTTEGFTWSVNVIGDDEVTLSDPRVDYSELISGTTVEIFPEIFTCPTDLTLYVDGVYEYTEVNTAYLDGANTDLEASAEVTVRCEIPRMPQGCTPGFWRQSHHYPYWTGYSPDQLFSEVFENAFPGRTLGEVVQLGGGGLNALGRHTVAALLNAASGEVNYGFGDGSAQAVIDAFNAVFPGGDYEGLKDDFEEYNEKGCSVDKSGDEKEKDGGGGPPAGRGRPAR